MIYLPNAHVSKRVDAVARLLDVLSDGVWDEFVHNFTEFRVGYITGDDFTHLLSDGADLRILRKIN